MDIEYVSWLPTQCMTIDGSVHHCADVLTE